MLEALGIVMVALPALLVPMRPLPRPNLQPSRRMPSPWALWPGAGTTPVYWRPTSQLTMSQCWALRPRARTAGALILFAGFR